MTVGGHRQAPAALPRERGPISIVQEAGGAPRSVRMRAENFDLTSIRPSHGQTCRQQIYRLSHPGPFLPCKGADVYCPEGSTADSYS